VSGKFLGQKEWGQLNDLQHRGIRPSGLLAHDHGQPAMPAFGQAHAHNLKFRAEIIQEIVRCRMKSQCRRNKIDERRSLLQGNPWKITVASNLSALQLPSNAQPIVRNLQRQMNVLAGLQFYNAKPSGTRHGQEIENTVFSAGIGKNLSVDVSLVQYGIDARDVLTNNRVQPALGLGTIERMARVACQRVAVGLQFMQQGRCLRERREPGLSSSLGSLILKKRGHPPSGQKAGRENATTLGGIEPQDARSQLLAPSQG
jgi:hypothetical protein